MNDVIIIQRIFPEYRKAIFDAIHRKVGFTLLHSENGSGIRQTAAPYSHPVKKWQYGKGDTQLYLDVFGYLKKAKPKVVIHELAVGIVSLPMLMMVRRMLGFKLILWGHTYNRKIGFDPQNHKSDKYRLWLQRRADGIITYSQGEKDVLVKNGIDAAKIFPALNTLDTNKYLPIRDRLAEEGKEPVKSRIGFNHQYNLIFIGRLYEDKWPDLALEVLHIMLRETSLSVALHFVGSGAIEKTLREYATRNGLQDHVFFHSEIFDESKTGELLFASDLMIMPGCVGLSVNHAYCFDCPVITFATRDQVPAHGPEIEYIIPGKTGFIVPGKKAEDMADTITNYFQDASLQVEIKQHIRNMIEEVCPIEKLTSGFEDAINYVQQQ